TKEAPIFGQRLAALRRAKGLSQTQLADLLDTTRKMIDYYERRAGNPSLDFIQRVAEALDVSVAELLGSEAKGHTQQAGPPAATATPLPTHQTSPAQRTGVHHPLHRYCLRKSAESVRADFTYRS